MPLIAGDVETIVNRALASVGEIATLPQITIRIIETVENPRSTARDLHEIIRNDPALSSKILKVVNSAFYGLPGQVGAIDRAIVLLGLSAVKNIAIAASIARLFKGHQITRVFSARDLWTHSLAVGVASRLLHKHVHNHGGDDVFLAGLIHDLGILAIRQAFPDQIREILNRVSETHENYCSVEVEVLGADHQAFGDGLAAKWKFPRHLRAAMGYHHNPEHLQDADRRLVTTIQVADMLCCNARYGLYLASQDQSPTPEQLAVLGLEDGQFADVAEQLGEQLALAESMFS
jgi:HD-like signal output (HDOD) protein